MPAASAAAKEKSNPVSSLAADFPFAENSRLDFRLYAPSRIGESSSLSSTSRCASSFYIYETASVLSVATYYRDSTTTLDYAQNRYYANTLGRFTSPDPYQASSGPSDPSSWNKYVYVQNDPVNFFDPGGMLMLPPPPAPTPPPSGGAEYGFGGGLGGGPDGRQDQTLLGDGGGGSPQPVPQNRDLLGSAIAQALIDLAKAGCGNAIFKSGLPDPGAVLQALGSGTGKYGSIIFAPLKADRAADEYSNGKRFILFGRRTVTIEINTYNFPGAGVYWNAGNTAVNAITLIHELAHAFNDLFGKGSSTLEPDVLQDGSPDPGAQARNTTRTDPCQK